MSRSRTGRHRVAQLGIQPGTPLRSGTTSSCRGPRPMRNSRVCAAQITEVGRAVHALLIPGVRRGLPVVCPVTEHIMTGPSSGWPRPRIRLADLDLGRCAGFPSEGPVGGSRHPRDPGVRSTRSTACCQETRESLTDDVGTGDHGRPSTCTQRGSVWSVFPGSSPQATGIRRRPQTRVSFCLFLVYGIQSEY